MSALPSRYVAPDSAEEAVAELAPDPGSAVVVGGGTWIVPQIARAEVRASKIIDLRRAGMRGIAAADGILHIGAMTTYADLLRSRAVAAWAPLLRLAAAEITGGWAIQEQGTLGGSIAAARPQSDLPAVLLACGAVALIQGSSGTRRVELTEMIAGPMRTTLGPDEIICGFELPMSSRSGCGYVKLARGHSSWPIAVAAALIELDGVVCKRAIAGLGGVSATPVLLDLDPVLVGGTVGAIAEAAAHACGEIMDPLQDALAPADYRAAVAAPVVRRALLAAWENAR